ncbi:rRNA maturation RNase YbeY [Fluviicola taffensis]|uniref:Endoribonuclease YbeY n=1 Tax=Fluviicola taffensis (strain DSM 16823 / NCIMB 13979 / RW262) TaxID=755732 RepID=F2IF55_FLUTR|nr:rRNA maturation RNase YbeY [Fluviicola taffensis]AEA43529.1 metalloprotease ybeY [Fluviicola taffensis DSM 16823]
MVEIFFEDIDEVPGVNPEFLFAWYSNVCEAEGKSLGDISLIFCSDEHLLEMNREYLQHDFFTDIITFDYTEEDLVSGDLFISVDRVRDNADEFDVLFQDELHRVCVHGLLHLCGYKDKSDEDEKLMRQKENDMLMLRKFHVEHLKA